jgi:hypothetical protein
VTRREWLAAIAAGIALSLAMTWPLVLHIGTRLPGHPASPADVLLEVWTIAWGGHALLHAPTHFFDANVFWPLRQSLAFSDSLAGLAPAGVIGSGIHAAVVRYDLLFLFAYTLAFVGAYALARALGARAPGATFAGAAFAYAPFRLAQEDHLHVLSSGGVPLSLALLVQGYREQRPRLVVSGWLVALWQVSLGWNLGLPFVYLLAALAVAAIVFRRRRPRRDILVATVVGCGLALTGILLLALVYIQVLHDHPEARRTPDILFFFSPTPRSLLATPNRDLVWGAATARFRAEPTTENTLFLGLTALSAAALGLFAGRAPRALRVGLALLAATLAVLSLGFGLHGGQASYRLLYDHAPGWQGLRSPGRLVTYTSLAVALLAALGVDRVVSWTRRFGGRPALLAATVLIGLALLEGYGSIGLFRPPPRPAAAAAAAAAAPQLVLPGDRDLTNAQAMFWSIGPFRPVANGWSGFHPTTYTELVAGVRSFPDAASVRLLQQRGIRSVLLDRVAVRGTSWAHAANRSVAGLPVRRTELGRFVLYTLRPSSVG